LDKVRNRLYEINDQYNLWPGITSSLVGDAEFKRYTDYQVMWEHSIIWGTHKRAYWVGGRGSSKSMISIDAYVKKFHLQPGTRVTWTPGDIVDQNIEPQEYFNGYFVGSANARYKGDKWQETEKKLANGSRIKFGAPTVGGTQSRRADILHGDEAQGLQPQIYKLIRFQAMRGNAQVNMTGTAKADTLFHQGWLASEGKENIVRMMTPAHLAVQGGVVSEAAVLDQMDDPLISKADKLEQLWCIWQKLSDRAFAPRFTDTLPREIMNNPDWGHWGWDFNKEGGTGHWGARARLLNDGLTVLVTKEEHADTYSEILDFHSGPIHPEDGGFNTGFCAALKKENEERLQPRELVPTMATDKERSMIVGELIRLQEHGRWVIYQPGVPLGSRDITRIPFNIKGVPDKEKAKELGLNPHVVDAIMIATYNAIKSQAANWSSYKHNAIKRKARVERQLTKEGGLF